MDNLSTNNKHFNLHCNWSKVCLLGSFTQFISSHIFPSRCAGCGLLGEVLCGRCVFKIQLPHKTHCPRCGQGGIFPHPCPCDKRNIPLTSLFSLGPTLRTVLHRTKYQNNPGVLKEILANPGSQQIQTLAFLAQHKNALVVPVPLHQKKFLERGYNVPTLLVQTLAGILSLKAGNILERVAETKAQAKIQDAHQREGNLVGAFQLMVGHEKKRHVILVDDVITSGATIEAAAKPLKEAGYGPVWGFSLAQEEW